MNALEAMTRLIEHASTSAKDIDRLREDPNFDVSPETREAVENLATAASVCQAMLNTALPIARFRLHVELKGVGEHIISSASIKPIRYAMSDLTHNGDNLGIRATLWEQKSTGADMLEGFEGNTRTPLFRLWVKNLQLHEANDGAAKAN